VGEVAQASRQARELRLEVGERPPEVLRRSSELAAVVAGALSQRVDCGCGADHTMFETVALERRAQCLRGSDSRLAHGFTCSFRSGYWHCAQVFTAPRAHI
jgi:hypothetical protein